MTTIINLYGGPGTGKSTSAAYIYFKLKSLGYNVELVREYVKDWAWEGRQFDSYVQHYFLGKQIRKESMLFNKVQYIITDSPVVLSLYYANAHSPTDIQQGVKAAVLGYYKQSEKDGHVHKHVLLNRTKKYNPSGRFQTEDQAKFIDGEIKSLLNEIKINYVSSETNEADLTVLVNDILGIKYGADPSNLAQLLPNCS